MTSWIVFCHLCCLMHSDEWLSIDRYASLLLKIVPLGFVVVAGMWLQLVLIVDLLFEVDLSSSGSWSGQVLLFLTNLSCQVNSGLMMFVAALLFWFNSASKQSSVADNINGSKEYASDIIQVLICFKHWAAAYEVTTLVLQTAVLLVLSSSLAIRHVLGVMVSFCCPLGPLLTLY